MALSAEDMTIDLSDDATFGRAFCTSISSGRGRMHRSTAWADAAEPRWGRLLGDESAPRRNGGHARSRASLRTGRRREGGGTGPKDEYQAGKFLNWTDDPRHKARALVSKGFTNRAIDELEAELRRRTVALIEALPENEPFDFVERFSRDLPLQAICLLLGVPQEDRVQLADGSMPALPHRRRRSSPRSTRGAARLRQPADRGEAQQSRDDILSTIVKARLGPRRTAAKAGRSRTRSCSISSCCCFRRAPRRRAAPLRAGCGP